MTTKTEPGCDFTVADPVVRVIDWDAAMELADLTMFGRIFWATWAAECDVEQLLALSQSRPAWRLFNQCIDGDAIALPKKGPPVQVTHLEALFVICVVNAIKNGALEHSEEWVYGENPSIQAQFVQPNLVIRFFNGCVELVKNPFCHTNMIARVDIATQRLRCGELEL
jgi:hypothetical protein